MSRPKHNTLDKAIKFMNTEKAVFIAVVLSMIPMFLFSVEMFRMAFTKSNLLIVSIEIIYAIAVDASILIHTLRGNKTKAYFFAIASVLTVLVVLFNPFWGWTTYIAYVLIATVLPVAIALYSHELKGKD